MGIVQRLELPRLAEPPKTLWETAPLMGLRRPRRSTAETPVIGTAGLRCRTMPAVGDTTPVGSKGAETQVERPSLRRLRWKHEHRPVFVAGDLNDHVRCTVVRRDAVTQRVNPVHGAH